jgi:spoIIIJ-associated protein
MTAVEKVGKTVEDALAEALQELNLTRDQVDVEVLEEPSKSFFGLVSRKAKIKVTPKAEPEPTVQQILAEAAAEVTKEAGTDKVEAPEEKQEPEAEAAKPAEGQAAEEHTARKEPREFVVDEAAVEAAKEFLRKIFEAMKIKVVMEKFVNRNLGSVIIKLHGDDMGILIGKHGQTLDALQYLTNLVANKNATSRMHIVIDVEDYRDRRVETLTRLAKRLAEKVKKSGQKVVLEPMNPHERKIIHTALQADKSVTTLSEGSDPYRRVVIELKK